MAQRLAIWLAAAVLVLEFGVIAHARAAQATGLCSCCLDPMPEACGTACAARQSEPGQCPAFVIYDGEGAVGPGGNPLNAMSLKELDIGKPRRIKLEGFRKFLEKYRVKAIRDWRAAARAYDRGKLTRDAFEEASTLYRDALVGYYHGIRAYRENIRAAPE
ncbi:MAG: hypothetical protein JNM20_12780 [Rhizobiales bacterium]|nr:hypothetical protein [Hyphomicrobiales bacterium]